MQFTPTITGVNRAIIGDMPVAIVYMSTDYEVQLSDTMYFNMVETQALADLLLSKGVVSLCCVTTPYDAAFNALPFASEATYRRRTTQLTDGNIYLTEQGQYTYYRDYRLTYYKQGSIADLCRPSFPAASRQGYMGCGYLILVNLNGNYIACGMSIRALDQNAVYANNPFSNGIKNNCVVGLPPTTNLQNIGSVSIYDLNPDISGIKIAETDPFEPGGTSDVGGGNGTFDGTSVDVDFTPLPTISATDTGFLTLYNPTLTQLQSLANYMWSNLFDLDTLKKLFGDPMEAILGLSIVPGPVPSASSQSVKIGNVDSGILMNKASTQYIDIDCGSLDVEEYWGAYIDYEPYTKAEIYLPFIGTHQLSVDDIMGKTVSIKYHIDLLSGGCACEIKCGGSVLYTFLGSCAVSIPVTGKDWTNLINGVLSAAANIGTMVATGGANAPAVAGEIASTLVNNLKPNIEKSGSVAGAGGLLAGKVPVLILTRPRQARPENQNKYTGYPSFVTRKISDLSGYTEVYSVLLGGISGTEEEINEILELLNGGVIL